MLPSLIFHIPQDIFAYNESKILHHLMADHSWILLGCLTDSVVVDDNYDNYYLLDCYLIVFDDNFEFLNYLI